MRFFWPKSLSGLMLLGVAVIAVPLLVAIFNAALQIQQLADSSRTIATEGIGSARASEDLMSEVLQLERATLQQQVLGPKLPDVYRENDAQLTESRTQLTHQLRTAAGDRRPDPAWRAAETRCHRNRGPRRQQRGHRCHRAALSGNEHAGAADCHAQQGPDRCPDRRHPAPHLGVPASAAVAEWTAAYLLPSSPSWC